MDDNGDLEVGVGAGRQLVIEVERWGIHSQSKSDRRLIPSSHLSIFHHRATTRKMNTDKETDILYMVNPNDLRDTPILPDPPFKDRG